MKAAYAIQPEDWDHSHMDEADAVRFGIYDTTDDGRHGAAGASFLAAYDSRPQAEYILGRLIEATGNRDDVGPQEAQAICLALNVLDPLGFRPEIGGGGSIFLSRYFDSGRYIWATGSEGQGVPALCDFLVCAYPPDDEGESVLDISNGPGQRGRLELRDAVAACVGYCEAGDPFAGRGGPNDGAYLYRVGGLFWTFRHVRYSHGVGWHLFERDGALCIRNDPEFARFRDDAEATEHVRKVAAGTINVFSARYRELCADAVKMMDTGQPDHEAQAAHAARSVELRDAMDALDWAHQTDAERHAFAAARLAFMTHHGFALNEATGYWRKANAAGSAEIGPSRFTGGHFDYVVDAGGLGTRGTARTLIGAVYDAEDEMNENGAGGAFAGPAETGGEG